MGRDAVTRRQGRRVGSGKWEVGSGADPSPLPPPTSHRPSPSGGGTPPEGEWFDAAFRAEYLEVYAHRDDAAAEREVAGLLPRLRAAPGPVLDAGCGGGRHLAALRRAGVPAFGFDRSADLLAVAGGRVEGRGRLTRGDLRAPPLADGAWGAVLLLFTVFGYFDDAENAACLARLARLLAPGGWLVLDLPDPDCLELVPESERRCFGGVLVRERRWREGANLLKTVEVERADGWRRTWTERVRLYRRDEIGALALATSLRLAELWPGLCGEAGGNLNSRMVVWLRNPTAGRGSPD